MRLEVDPDEGTLRVFELTIKAKRDPGSCTRSLGFFEFF